MSETESDSRTAFDEVSDLSMYFSLKFELRHGLDHPDTGTQSELRVHIQSNDSDVIIPK